MRTLRTAGSLALTATLVAAMSTPLTAQQDMSTHATTDIVETAVAAGSFNTLARALEAAGLIDVLKGEGPFTVFAPTDEAFAALPEGTLEALLEDTEKLKAVLTYHVVPGSVTSAEVVNLDSAATVQGQEVSIRIVDGNVLIDEATVIQADVAASNGVIHVIDSVILPEM